MREHSLTMSIVSLALLAAALMLCVAGCASIGRARSSRVRAGCSPLAVDRGLRGGAVEVAALSAQLPASAAVGPGGSATPTLNWSLSNTFGRGTFTFRVVLVTVAGGRSTWAWSLTD